MSVSSGLEKMDFFAFLTLYDKQNNTIILRCLVKQRTYYYWLQIASIPLSDQCVPWAKHHQACWPLGDVNVG